MIKRTIFGAALALLLFLNGGPVSADQPCGGDLSLSGLATNALVAAYKVSGLSDGVESPTPLRSYIVMMQTNANYFDIWFLSQTQPQVITVVVEALTGRVVWAPRSRTAPEQLVSPPQGVMLPGTVAGEIVAAHQSALSQGYKPLAEGAYYIQYLPFTIGLNIAFIPLGVGLPAITIRPRPVATNLCSGTCPKALELVVHVRNGAFTVGKMHEPNMILH